MAHLSYISITGEKQGMISKGSNSEDSIGSRYQANHTDEISVLAFEHSQEKNIHGPNQHFHPLMITKLVDKSSPLLGIAFNNQEKLQCELSLYRTNDRGYNEKYYTIKLVDALVVALNLNQPHVGRAGNEETHEVVSFSYKDIIWKHNTAGTEGYATWKKN